jgi:hypothetical protein
MAKYFNYFPTSVYISDRDQTSLDVVTNLTFKFKFNDNTSIILPENSKIKFPDQEFQFQSFSVLDPYLIGVTLCCKHKHEQFWHKNLVQIKNLKTSYYQVEIDTKKFPKIKTKDGYSKIFWYDVEKLGIDCRLKLRFIPEEYLYSSPEDRKSLLDGILAVNGKFDRNLYFNTSSHVFAKDASFLIRSLGGVARISKYETPTPFYKVSFWLSLYFNDKQKQKKVKSQEGVGKQPCIYMEKPFVTNDFLEIS